MLYPSYFLKIFSLLIVVSLNAWKLPHLAAADYQSLTLSNQLQVVLDPRAHAPSTYVRIWVRAGSVHEPLRYSNTAHIIEHLFFGPPRSGRPAYFTQVKPFANVTATTRLYSTLYTADLPSADLSKFLEIEAVRFKDFDLQDPQYLEAAIQTIKKEHLQNYSQPPFQMWRATFKEIFAGHPMGMHTSGHAGDFENIKTIHIQDYYQNYYRPENTCVVLSGGFDKSSILKTLNRTLGTWLGSKTSAPIPTIPPPVKKAGPIYYPLDATYTDQLVVAAYPIAVDATAEEHALARIANHIYSQSKNSLVSQFLTNKHGMQNLSGDFNFDYDWGLIKVLLRSAKTYHKADLLGIFQEMTAHVSKLSLKDIENYRQEYLVWEKESMLQTRKRADFLALECGKYQFSFSLIEKMKVEAIQKFLNETLSMNQLRLLVSGDRD